MSRRWLVLLLVAFGVLTAVADAALGPIDPPALRRAAPRLVDPSTRGCGVF